MRAELVGRLLIAHGAVLHLRDLRRRVVMVTREVAIATGEMGATALTE